MNSLYLALRLFAMTLVFITVCTARAAVVVAVDINIGGSGTESDTFIDPNDASSMAFQGVTFSLPETSFSQSFVANPDFTQAGSVTFELVTSTVPSEIVRTTLTGTYSDLYNDAMVIGGAGATLSLSGLLPTTEYSVYLWSFEPAAQRDAIWTPTTPGVVNPSAITLSGALSPDPSNSLVLPNASALFTSVGSNALTSSSTGVLTFNLEDGLDGNSGARFNGFAITAIPEPSVYYTIIIGFVLLLAIRKPRR